MYINLEKRTDRKEEIEKELNDFKLEYERFDAIARPEQGILGCGLSHLEVLKLAKQNNYENILILEDDFTFLITKEEFEKELQSFFDLKLDFDVVFLSYFMQRHIPLENGVVDKVLEAQTASGYIVNKNYYDVLINLYEHAMPLLEQTQMHWIYCNDQVWKELQEKDNWYFFKKRIGKQRDGNSNNTGRFQTYDC